MSKEDDRQPKELRIIVGRGITRKSHAADLQSEDPTIKQQVARR
jgi:hypothetical protein